MGRWEPNARGRLQQAAMALFLEHGYARTTVEDIAARAGLTERTFFRHFADKREVLFYGSEQLQAGFSDAVDQAPEGASPFEAVGAGLGAIASLWEVPREHARLRQSVIASHKELQERELIKMSALSAGVAEALRGRGVTEPAATLAAEAGVAVFKVAFERWLDGEEGRDFGFYLGEAIAAMKGVLG